jgi:hypothetical protein
MAGTHRDVTLQYQRRAQHRFPAIPGSRLLRAFCGRCGQPIRIHIDKAVSCVIRNADPMCVDCDEGVEKPHTSRASVLTPRQAACLKKTTGG